MKSNTRWTSLFLPLDFTLNFSKKTLDFTAESVLSSKQVFILKVGGMLDLLPSKEGSVLRLLQVVACSVKVFHCQKFQIRWLSERTMTGSPTLSPTCKCRKLPGRNWNGNKTPAAEAPGSTAMDQCIMGTATHLHRQPQAVLQVRVVGSLVDTQGSPVLPLFLRILLFLPSTNPPLLLLQFLPTLSFLRTTLLPL